MFQGMTASLFPLNKCGLPGLTGPLTRTCNTGGQQLQTCCFFMLFPSFEVLFVSACVAIAPAERRLLWQKWAVQPLSHQPIVDSGWLHPSRISCQVATTSSALHNDHRVAGHCLPKFMALKTWPTSSQHNILGLLRLRILMYGMKWDQNGMSNHVKCQFRTESSYAVRSVSREASPSQTLATLSFISFLSTCAWWVHLTYQADSHHFCRDPVPTSCFLQVSISSNFCDHLSTDWFVIISFHILWYPATPASKKLWRCCATGNSTKPGRTLAALGTAAFAACQGRCPAWPGSGLSEFTGAGTRRSTVKRCFSALEVASDLRSQQRWRESMNQRESPWKPRHENGTHSLCVLSTAWVRHS